MDNLSASTFINLLIVGVIGLVVFGFGALLVRSKTAAPELVSALLPDEVELLIKQAVQYATLFVEQADVDGNLGQFFDEIKDKGQQKLELAIDVASERLEAYLDMFFAERGIDLHIDIPEAFIKDAIQKYVWENPQLFPPKAKEDAEFVKYLEDVEAARAIQASLENGAGEQNAYAGYRRQARQPANYPAQAQVWSDPDLVVKAEDKLDDETSNQAHD